jgi:hypothetical protein
MDKTFSIGMTEAQWRQLLLERLMEIEAIARTSHYISVQAMQLQTKANHATLLDAANDMITEYRAKVELAVAASVVRMKSEAPE